MLLSNVAGLFKNFNEAFLLGTSSISKYWKVEDEKKKKNFPQMNITVITAGSTTGAIRL